MKKHLLCALATLAATPAFAETLYDNEGFYAGAGISRYQYQEPASGSGLHLETLDLNAGFWFNPLLSAEVRVGTSLGDRESDAGNVLWEVGVDSFASVYWRPEFVNKTAKLYGLIGYSQVEISAEGVTTAGAPRSLDLSEGGPSFGAGIGFFYNPDVTVNLEWKQLIDADGFEMSGFTAGVDYRF